MSEDLPFYVCALTAGPLMLLQVPSKGKPGLRGNAIRRPVWNRAITALMREHGLRRRDFYSLDPVFSPDDRYEGIKRSDETLIRLERAYAGDPEPFPKFLLYRWDPESERFVLARGAS